MLHCRLIRAMTEYTELLNMVRSGTNIQICEIDANEEYLKLGVPVNNTECEINMGVINTLLHYPGRPFGHCLCIAKALIEDM